MGNVSNVKDTSGYCNTTAHDVQLLALFLLPDNDRIRTKKINYIYDKSHFHNTSLSLRRTTIKNKI